MNEPFSWFAALVAVSAHTPGIEKALQQLAQRHTDDSRNTIVAPPNNLPYIVAVVLMMVIGVIGVVAVTILRPSIDNTSVITTIVGFLAPTTMSLLAFMKAQETHLSVNSRLDAFMRNAELAAHVQGLVEGRNQGREDANARTDALAGDARDAVAAVAATAAVTAQGKHKE